MVNGCFFFFLYPHPISIFPLSIPSFYTYTQMRSTSVFGILIALAGTHQLTFAGECSNAPFDRCGGKGWEGSECCTEGYECKVQNTYYSQCVPVDQSESSCAKAYGQCGGKFDNSLLL